MARTEVASGGTGSVLERPGRGQGAGTAPGAVGPDPPREHPGVRGPGPPPARRGEAAPTSSPTLHARPPPSTIWKSTASESDTSKIPRPLRPPSPSRAAFLPRRFREGERIPRTESAGKDGEGEGGGRAREPLPRFFFSSRRIYPLLSLLQAQGSCRGGWGWGTRAGGRSPARCGPKVEANPLPGPVFLGCPGERRVPQQCGAKFSPGSPARQERSGTRSHSRGLGVRPGLSSARDLVAEAWGPGPLQSPDPASLTFPRAETRGSGRATHRVAHAFPAGSPEDPRCPLRRSRRRRRRSPPPPAAAAAQITTRRV